LKLAANDGHIVRGFNSQSNRFALGPQDGDDDAIANTNLLLILPC
jgi:hypothetical protein